MNQEKKFKCNFKCAVRRVNIDVEFYSIIQTLLTLIFRYIYLQLLLGCLNFDLILVL